MHWQWAGERQRCPPSWAQEKLTSAHVPSLPPPPPNDMEVGLQGQVLWGAFLPAHVSSLGSLLCSGHFDPNDHIGREMGPRLGPALLPVRAPKSQDCHPPSLDHCRVEASATRDTWEWEVTQLGPSCVQCSLLAMKGVWKVI